MLIAIQTSCSAKIVNREQLLTAVYTALQAASSGTLKTKTLHSEVLLALHPSATVSPIHLSSIFIS